MDFPVVLEHHLASGALTRINDSTYGVTSTKHGASATVRLLPGRATVEFAHADNVPSDVPSSPVLRAQIDKFHGSFYASAQQLDGFLLEMA